MKASEQKFLDSLSEGALKEQWRKAYAAVRFNPPVDVPQTADPKVWTPPANPPLMPNPIDPPPGTTTPLPPVTWAEYWEYFSFTPGWTPGFYSPQQFHVQGIYWMSKLAA
jgi:hypothetical protein